jgi:1,4-dihydroxy-2-naphthoyl-CoA synthase
MGHCLSRRRWDGYAMGETRLTLDIAGGVARATFETEGGLNVLSSPVLERIHAVAEEVRAAEGVRVMILAATGKVFVAGADIKELWGLDSAGARSVSELGNRAFDAIANLPCVTIARLHGAALGGGLEVALACDFRYALASAKIGLPESALGLVPGWKGHFPRTGLGRGKHRAAIDFYRSADHRSRWTRIRADRRGRRGHRRTGNEDFGMRRIPASRRPARDQPDQAGAARR